jgi:serine/threonine-protein kinase
VRRLKILGITIAAALLTFTIGYLVAVRLLFPPLPEPENGIIVPRLTGLSVPAAEARLRQLGLRVTESTQIAHPTQPPGLIIAQSPLPGQQLRQLGSVRLAVSAGLPRVPVPNVIGLTAERARSVLAALGFEADERTEEASAAEGTVVRVAPPAGSEQPVPSRVVIFLSSGPPPPPLDTLPVPQDTVPLPHTSE